MSSWNNTIKTALLGTGRTALAPINLPGALGETLQALPWHDEPHALLAAAGAVALHAQTGWRPSQTRPPVPFKTQADLPACSPEVSSQLDALLEGSNRVLLPEMLAALAQTNHRAADILLPNLLEKGARQVNLRPFILPVLGQRGRWLADQNPVWVYASLKIESWTGLLEYWQTAEPPQRQALLRQLRLSQPAHGRQILEHTWRSNNALNRNLLLKTLDNNLSLEDEPFLEMTLDDRDQLVRRSAADLLARLPESRLGRRMKQHVAGLLTWTPGEKQAITVRFPLVLTPAMLRDGIPDVKKADLAKLRARLLTQIVSRVPLAHWTEKWQHSPLEIALAARKSAWPRTLTAAFTTAAIRQKNDAWAEALILANEFNASTGRLVPVLSAGTSIRLMQQAAKATTQLARNQPLTIFLQHWPAAWTETMAEFLLDQFARLLPQTESSAPDPTLNNMLIRFGQKCPPQLAEMAASRLHNTGNEKNGWQKSIQKMCRMVAFRHDLLAEISRHAAGPEAA